MISSCRRVVGTVLAVAMLVLATPAESLAVDAVRLDLPAPTGKQRVGTISLHLVDEAREDSLAPTPRPRELMVRLWYPAARSWQSLARYMSPAHSDVLVQQINAVTGTDYPADLLAFRTHSRAGAPVEGTRHPVVVLSPGYGGNAALHTGLAEELASRGYVVVGIDHTYDVAVVEFPDGRLEPLTTDEITDFDRSVATRVADTRFVLDRLTDLAAGHNPDAAHRRLPAGLGRALDLTRVAALGHSRGSVALVRAIAADPRFDGGVALDGGLLGPISLDRPFMLFGNQHNGHAGNADWAVFYDLLRGPRLWVVVDGVEHVDLTDATVFKAAIDLSAVYPELGSIDGARSLTIQHRYVTAWLDFALRGRHDPILGGESPEFPEVDFQP